MPVGVVDVVGVIGSPATSLEQAKVPKTVGMHHQTNAFSVDYLTMVMSFHILFRHEGACDFHSREICTSCGK